MGGRGSTSRTGKTSASIKDDLASRYLPETMAKVGTQDSAPDWWLDKKLSWSERAAVNTSGGASVKRETEKAVLFSYDTDYGEVTVWTPKSILNYTVEDAQKEAYRKSSMELGSYYNAYLKNVASTNGVKLGNSKRTDAITSKLSKSGVSYMSKDEFGNLPASSVKSSYSIKGYYY